MSGAVAELDDRPRARADAPVALAGFVAWRIALATAPLAALPLLVPFWPGQDNPNNVAIAHILARAADSDSPFEPWLRTNLHAGPYSLYYGLLLLLGRVVGVQFADRILLAVFVLALPLLVLALVRRLAPEREANAFLVIPMALSWSVVSGILSFHVGLLFGLAALAVAAPPAPASRARLAAAGALVLVGTLGHPLLPLFVGVAWLALEGPRLATRAAWVRIVLVFLPAAVLLGASIAAALAGDRRALLLGPIEAHGGGIHYQHGDAMAWVLVRENLVALSWTELPFRLIPVALLVGGTVLAARRTRLGADSADAATVRLAIAAFLLFFALPRGAFHWSVITPRAAFFATLMLAPAAVLPRAVDPRRAAWIGAAASMLLAIVGGRAMLRESNRLAKVAAAESAIPHGATLLPLSFEPYGNSVSIRSELHAWGPLVESREVIVPYLFAATGSPDDLVGANFRPLVYREPFGPTFLPNPGEDAAKHLRAADECPAAEPQRNACLVQATRAIVADATHYDRVLALTPPPLFIDLATNALQVVYHDDFVWVLKPR